MQILRGRHVVSGVVAVGLAVSGSVAVAVGEAPGDIAAAGGTPAASPTTLGYVASVSASVRRPVGRRLVVTPRATYVITRPDLAKVLRALAVKRSTARPLLTLTYRVRIAGAPLRGKGRTLATLSRTLSGQQLITAAGRKGTIVRFRLGRFVLSPAQTLKIKRAWRSGKLQLSSSADYRVRITARGRTTTLTGVPWRFTWTQSFKRQRFGGAKLSRLNGDLRTAMTQIEKWPLACRVRTALVRRLRAVGSVLLSGRRTAAANMLRVWAANPGSMGGGVLSEQQRASLLNTLRSILRGVGTGSPATLSRVPHWPALSPCGTTARAASDGAVSGARTVGVAASYGADDVFSPDDFKTLVTGLIRVIPEAGGLLSTFVSMLWPSDDPLKNVKVLIDQAMSQQVINNARAALGVVSPPEGPSGIAGDLSTFLVQEAALTDTDPGLVGSDFDTTKKLFTDRRGSFAPPEGTVTASDRFKLLPLFAQYQNLYLALLREGILNGPQWGYSPTAIELLRTEMGQALSSGHAYVNKVHEDRLTADKGSATSAETIFARTSIDERAFQLGVGDFQAQWKFFDPVAYPAGDPNFRLTRMIYSERIGSARHAFAKPGNVPYPLTFITAFSKQIVNSYVVSINAVKADHAPVTGVLTGDTESTTKTGDRIVNNTRTWSVTQANPIVEAWGDDLWGNPNYIDGLHFRYANGSASNFGSVGPSYCREPEDLHLGCGAHQYSFDDQSLQAIRIAGAFEPMSVRQPGQHLGDSLVFGFRFTDSFYPSGRVQSVGQAGRCMDVGSWKAGTGTTLIACGDPGPTPATQTWTYDSTTRELSTSNGEVDPKFAPSNVGTLCLQAPAAVNTYDCSEQPRTDMPPLTTTPAPTLSQQWIVSSDGSIMNAATKLCLEAVPALGGATLLQPKGCNANINQQWTTPWTVHLPGTLRALNRQTCLHATGTRETDEQLAGQNRSAPVANMQTCDGSWQQSWYHNTVDKSTLNEPDITYRALMVYGGTKCLAPQNGGSTPATLPVGTTVVVKDCNGGAAQKWTVNADTTIRPAGANVLCLARRPGEPTPGTPVTLDLCVAGAGNQQWVWPLG